jgi:hypothetical protein
MGLACRSQERRRGDSEVDGRQLTGYKRYYSGRTGQSVDIRRFSNVLER